MKKFLALYDKWFENNHELKFSAFYVRIQTISVFMILPFKTADLSETNFNLLFLYMKEAKAREGALDLRSETSSLQPLYFNKHYGVLRSKA